MTNASSCSDRSVTSPTWHCKAPCSHERPSSCRISGGTEPLLRAFEMTSLLRSVSGSSRNPAMYFLPSHPGSLSNWCSRSSWRDTKWTSCPSLTNLKAIWAAEMPPPTTNTVRLDLGHSLKSASNTWLTRACCLGAQSGQDGSSPAPIARTIRVAKRDSPFDSSTSTPSSPTTIRTTRPLI